MQDHVPAAGSDAAKHEQLGEFGAIPGAPNGPPIDLSQSRKGAENGKETETTVEQSAGADAETPPSKPLQNVAFSSEELEIHPAANIFPPMREKQFQELKESIATQGLHEPIWTFEGKVIDGRHRLRACKETGVAPRFQEWDGKGSLLDFVISLNLHRRHLKEAQRAMVAARIKPQFEEEAKRRQGWASKDGDLQPNWAEGQARDQAAQLLSVGHSSVTRALKVLNKGAPALIAAVDACKLAVSTAAELCEFPHEEQTRLLAAGREEIAKKLKSTRSERKTAAKQPVAKAPTLDPAIEKKLINHFTNGWVKLTKTEQGFRMQFCDYYLDELERAMNSQHFKTLMEHGVYMVKVSKDVA